MNTGIASSSDAIPGNALIQHAAVESDLGADMMLQILAEHSKQGELLNENIVQVAPPAKKAKTTRALRAGQQATKSRRRKNLSTLLDMPLDVLFEVIGHLTPKDLVNVSKTTKTLRATLMAKSATSVWKASRQRSGGPDPPRDISEPHWAILIFTNVCTSCGVNNVQIIDFRLRRRMCKKCKQQNLVAKAKVLYEYPGVGRSILDLISPTSDGDSFWRRDIEHVSKAVIGYEARMAQGDPGAEVELTKFREERIEHVKQIHHDLAVYTPWIEEAIRQKKKKNVTLVQERVKMARDRFHQLGYLDSDMPYLDRMKEMKVSGKMSDKYPVWESFRELHEPVYFKTRERRRENEDCAIRRSRRAMLHRMYDSYKMTIEASQWKYLPSTDAICCLQPFRGLVTANANETVSEASFAACIDVLAEALETANAGIKKRLLAQVHDVPDSERSSSTLELVEHSFRCTTGSFLENCGQVLYGWDEISSHHCAMAKLDVGTSPLDSPTIGIFDHRTPRFLEELPSNFSYCNGNRRTSALVMAEISGLEPTSATVAQMDDLDLRYTCVLCNKKEGKVIAYTWRGCIEHLQRQHIDKQSFNWVLDLTFRYRIEEKIVPLSAADADFVKAKERELERGPESKWACTHCPAHLTHSIQYADVIQHVRETHDIDSPEEVVDLISFRRMRKDYDIVYEPIP